ncbi:uncharacterized protein V6R79_012910 [Siganus canaliculatus]
MLSSDDHGWSLPKINDSTVLKQHEVKTMICIQDRQEGDTSKAAVHLPPLVEAVTRQHHHKPRPNTASGQNFEKLPPIHAADFGHSDDEKDTVHPKDNEQPLTHLQQRKVMTPDLCKLPDIRRAQVQWLKVNSAALNPLPTKFEGRELSPYPRLSPISKKTTSEFHLL